MSARQDATGRSHGDFLTFLWWRSVSRAAKAMNPSVGTTDPRLTASNLSVRLRVVVPSQTKDDSRGQWQHRCWQANPRPATAKPIVEGLARSKLFRAADRQAELPNHMKDQRSVICGAMSLSGAATNGPQAIEIRLPRRKSVQTWWAPAITNSRRTIRKKP